MGYDGRLRCSCGRFIGAEYGWFKYGEHGTGEGWVCARCLPTWTPRDGRGRGPEAGYCGVVRPTLDRARQEGRREGLEEALGALERIEVGGSNSTFDLAQRMLKEIAFDEVRALATGKDRG